MRLFSASVTVSTVAALLVLGSYLIPAADSASIVMAMICRDEAVNIKTNIPLWMPLIDYFVFLVDNRTVDDTVGTIHKIIGSDKSRYKVISYEFTGFGQARTLSLKETWNHYSSASHVLIADPDWIPISENINHEELDDPKSEVFRFVAYDRNGQTTRRMDWLLRNREGLQMRYHLHEVLDIGPYMVKYVDFVVREVEKPGSWHTTIGHGNSMSAKRYLFDLDLLQKDLVTYGHDPHTHYYLGITHEAYAQRLLAETGRATDTILEHVAMAERFMKLRIYSEYKDEFVEERWGCMFSLGSLYANYKKDLANAVHWLSMCRDFNPAQTECGLALAKVYLGFGMFRNALEEAELLLKTEKKDRVMLNHFKDRQCDIPLLMIELLIQKEKLKVLSANEAKYFLLMVRMLDHDLCVGKKYTIDEYMKPALRMHLNSKGTLTLSSSMEQICLDEGLQAFIISSKILLHPCGDINAFQTKQEQLKMCQFFTGNMPSAVEDLQASTVAGRFIGAASIPDIIHHVYLGDSRRVYDLQRPFRILFAEYFQIEMVYSLIGFINLSKGVKNFEITVLTEDVARVHQIKDTLELCNENIPIGLKIIYLETSVESLINVRKASLSNTIQYDYIEYNCGISKSSNPLDQLQGITSYLLSDAGSIGISYFTKNVHYSNIQKYISNRNATAHIPFSLQAHRFIKNYFNLHGLTVLENDQDLVTFLGGNTEASFPPRRLSEVEPRLDWKAYSKEEALNLIHSSGLQTQSWMPTAYAYPYEEIDFFSVQKYRSLGVTEKDFTEEYLTNFRYTIYCTKDSYSSNTGRVKLSMDIFTSNAAKNIIVSDRIGTLSQSFAAATELSTNGIPTIFSFAHYSNHKQFNFTYVAMPGTAPCLTILSSGKSVQDLLKYNKEFSIKSRFQFSLKQLQNELIELLSFFEKLNMISYWSTNGPIASSGSSTTASITTIDVKKKQQNDLKVQNQVREIVSDEKFTRVGGLLIDFNEEIETIEVQSDEVLELQKIDNADEIDTEKKDESRKKSSNKQNNSDKIQRMKDLGFDDDLIQEMLSDSDLSANDKSSDSKSFESDVDGDLIDAEVDRDGDGKMTDSESTADTVADFQQTISEQQKIIEKEVETKEKIAGILKVLQENDVKKLGALLSQVDKNPDIADKKSAKESTIIGGLLNNPKFTEKLKALENKQTYSHSIGQNNFDENTGSYSVNEAKEKEELKEFIEKSLSIRMPGGVQTMESLVNSYRKIDCFYYWYDNKGEAERNSKWKSECKGSVPRRKTAGISYASLRSIQFFTAQMKYLQRTFDSVQPEIISIGLEQYRQLLLKNITNAILPHFKLIYEQINSSPWNDPKKPIRLTDQQLVSGAFSALNRLVHIERDSVANDNYIYMGAAKYIMSIAPNIYKSDFAVVDIIVTPEVLTSLASVLLKSTFYYDVTNGISYVSHYDDGLVHPSFGKLAQQMAYALSTRKNRMRVTKYYVMAMNLMHKGHSPISIANKDELAAILWITPTDDNLPENNDDNEDGLRVCGDYAANKLFSEGISIYPSVHTEYLSKSNDLSIDLFTRCNITTSELIPRKSNRLVVVRAGRPYVFTTPGNVIGKPFESSTMTAFVVILSQSNLL